MARVYENALNDEALNPESWVKCLISRRVFSAGDVNEMSLLISNAES